MWRKCSLHRLMFTPWAGLSLLLSHHLLLQLFCRVFFSAHSFTSFSWLISSGVPANSRFHVVMQKVAKFSWNSCPLDSVCWRFRFGVAELATTMFFGSRSTPYIRISSPLLRNAIVLSYISLVQAFSSSRSEMRSGICPRSQIVISP